MSDIDKRLDEISRRYIGNYETVDSYEKSINEANQAIKQLMVDEFNNILNFIDTDTNDVCWKHSPNDNPMIHASRIEYLTEYVDQKLKELKK